MENPVPTQHYLPRGNGFKPKVTVGIETAEAPATPLWASAPLRLIPWCKPFFEATILFCQFHKWTKCNTTKNAPRQTKARQTQGAVITN